MSAALSERQAWLSRLEEELATARKFEAASKEHLAAQEERVAQLKAKKVHRRDSERLLVLLRRATNFNRTTCDCLKGIFGSCQHRSRPSRTWIKVKNPKAPATTRAIDGTF